MLLLHQEMEASASPKARRRFAVHFAGSAMAEEISREGVCVCVFGGGAGRAGGRGGAPYGVWRKLGQWVGDSLGRCVVVRRWTPELAAL